RILPNSSWCDITVACTSATSPFGYSSSRETFLVVSPVKAKMEGMRTRKNSSRLEEKMERNDILLYRGTEGSAASFKTLWLKLSQLRSRLRKVNLSPAILVLLKLR